MVRTRICSAATLGEQTGSDELSHLLLTLRDGTLFLHDVSELNRLEQRGLLLLIGKLDKYNARLVCAVSRSLPDMVAAGTFDVRLFGALSAVTVSVPSLRQHREDVPELASLMLARGIEAKELPQKHFSTAALNALRCQSR